MNHKPYGSYEKYFKRLLDIVCSLAAIIVFSWLYIILIILGAIFMRGNPFFTQERPGKDEKIFKLIKFRSMDNRKDKNGNLLPDEVRLNKYGQFLRKTSLDELPEAFNILKGDMSIIGPRPLLVSYLPWYTEEEKQRHDVRPGLSGLAQVNGRNSVTWEEKFSCIAGKKYDVKNSDKRLEVAIPAKVSEDLRMWSEYVYENHAVEKVTVDSSIRKIGVNIDYGKLENTGDLTVIDVPLTLSAAYRSVELALGVDYIGIEEIMELAKEKELNNFIKTVNNLILEDIYTRKSVSVRKVYKDKL